MDIQYQVQCLRSISPNTPWHRDKAFGFLAIIFFCHLKRVQVFIPRSIVHDRIPGGFSENVIAILHGGNPVGNCRE
jgi:hypothetical protein